MLTERLSALSILYGLLRPNFRWPDFSQFSSSMALLQNELFTTHHLQTPLASILGKLPSLRNNISTRVDVVLPNMHRWHDSRRSS